MSGIVGTFQQEVLEKGRRLVAFPKFLRFLTPRSQGSQEEFIQKLEKREEVRSENDFFRPAERARIYITVFCRL